MTSYYFIPYIIGIFYIGQLCCSTDAAGQDSYDIKYSTGSYSNLVSSTSLNNGQLWDDPEYHIPIGFTFEFFDQLYDSVYVSDYVWFDQNTKYWIYAFDSDFMDKGIVTSESTISYLLTGSPGTQILKIEWGNVGFYDDTGLTDFINVQLWLFEGTNEIGIYIGPNSVLNPDSYGGLEGGVIAVVDYITPEEIYLTGAPDNALIVNGYSELNGTPVDGAIYSFTKCINPQAMYDYSVDSSLTATFTTNIPNATYFFWDFGDGTTSLLANPTHTYVDTGIYPGYFVVSNNCDTDTTATMMCIYPDAPIIIDISTAPDVTYTTLTTNAASYYWDFGDSTGASGMSQSHTYNLPGTYTVALVVDYGCGPDSLFQTISPVFIGIEEMISDVEKTFEIYPNPASDEITLTSQTIGGKMTIAITDMSGRVIIPYVCTNESNAHLGTADISRLNPGMYYITILSDQTVTSRKLIKF